MLIPSQRARGLGFAALLMALAMGAASGAIYVMIPNVPGDVTAEGYEEGKWFEATGGTIGADRMLPESTEDGTADVNIGIGELKSMGLVAYVGRPMGPLAQAAISGELLGDVEIHLADIIDGPNGDEVSVFAIIKLRRAFATSFEMKTEKDQRPWYQVFLSFSALEIINISPGEPGVSGQEEATVSWDYITNKVRLSIIPPLDIVDTDGDGMSDEYEEMHFGSKTGGMPHKDSDGDGESDLKEFLAGTDPNDPDSVFEANVEPDDGDAMKVVIKTELGFVYELRSSDDLRVFFLVASVVGDGGLVELVDPNPGGRRFYQITIARGS